MRDGLSRVCSAVELTDVRLRSHQPALNIRPQPVVRAMGFMTFRPRALGVSAALTLADVAMV